MTKYRCAYTLLSFTIMCCGCTTATVNENTYPAGWPAPVSRDKSCTEIEGRYLDRGQVTGDQQTRSATSLSAILTDEAPPQAHTLAIDVVNNHEIAITAYDMKQAAIRVSLKKNTGFTCKDGAATLTWGHGALDPLATFTESRTLILSKAVDGSLIVEKYYSGQGYFFLVPFSDRIHSWARFERADK